MVIFYRPEFDDTVSLLKSIRFGLESGTACTPAPLRRFAAPTEDEISDILLVEPTDISILKNAEVVPIFPPKTSSTTTTPIITPSLRRPKQSNGVRDSREEEQEAPLPKTLKLDVSSVSIIVRKPDSESGSDSESDCVSTATMDFGEIYDAAAMGSPLSSADEDFDDLFNSQDEYLRRLLAPPGGVATPPNGPPMPKISESGEPSTAEDDEDDEDETHSKSGSSCSGTADDGVSLPGQRTDDAFVDDDDVVVLAKEGDGVVKVDPLRNAGRLICEEDGIREDPKREFTLFDENKDKYAKFTIIHEMLKAGTTNGMGLADAETNDNHGKPQVVPEWDAAATTYNPAGEMDTTAEICFNGDSFNNDSFNDDKASSPLSPKHVEHVERHKHHVNVNNNNVRNSALTSINHLPEHRLDMETKPEPHRQPALKNNPSRIVCKGNQDGKLVDKMGSNEYTSNTVDIFANKTTTTTSTTSTTATTTTTAITSTTTTTATTTTTIIASSTTTTSITTCVDKVRRYSSNYDPAFLRNSKIADMGTTSPPPETGIVAYRIAHLAAMFEPTRSIFRSADLVVRPQRPASLISKSADVAVALASPVSCSDVPLIAVRCRVEAIVSPTSIVSPSSRRYSAASSASIFIETTPTGVRSRIAAYEKLITGR